MAWNDAEEICIAGTGQLYLAPVGTALPAPNSDPTTALNAAFVGAGYTAEDGATFRGTPEITEHRAWQNTSAIRRARKSQDLEILCDLLQWNEDTVKAAFGGGTVTGSGPYTYTFPVAGDALAEYSVVLDVQDGDNIMRFVVERMNSGLETVESQFNADNMAVLPIALKSLASDTAPYMISNNNAAFVAGS
jgi:hypothetical protein